MSDEVEGQLKRQYDDLLNKVVAALADRTYAKVAKNVRLHENTIRAIAQGRNKNPSIETLETLSDYLFGKA